MAKRRMLSAGFMRQEAFLDLPLAVQAVYVQLVLFADDDGFVDNPSRVVRMVDGEQTMLSLLEEKGFLISFDSGCGVIRHWLKHNNIRKDRYTPTVYQREMATLRLTEDLVYELRKNREGVLENAVNLDPAAAGSAPETNILKAAELTDQGPEQEKEPEEPGENGPEASDPGIPDRGISRQAAAPAAPAANPDALRIPTLEEVRTFAATRKSRVKADEFYHHYAATGWCMGRTLIRDWKAAFYLWESREEYFLKKDCRHTKNPLSGANYSQRDYSDCEDSMDEVLNRLKKPQDMKLAAVSVS